MGTWPPIGDTRIWPPPGGGGGGGGGGSNDPIIWGTNVPITFAGDVEIEWGS